MASRSRNVRVVSVSLGASSRDAAVETEVLGYTVTIERIGTDGDFRRALQLIRCLDGEVDCIGLGGVNLNLNIFDSSYKLRSGQLLAKAARRTPVVDGEMFKRCVEPGLVAYVESSLGFSIKGKHVLISSALDRYWLAREFEKRGAKLLICDAMFALRLPIGFSSLRAFGLIAKATLPLLSKLPVEWLYPLGRDVPVDSNRYSRQFDWADVLAGDFHFLRKWMPSTLADKLVITSTLTVQDIEQLKLKGAKGVALAAHPIGGRCFGANVYEAVTVAVSGLGRRLNAKEYEEVWRSLGIQPYFYRF